MAHDKSRGPGSEQAIVVARQVLYLHGMEAIGGAEQDLLLLLQRLDRTRWRPTVACPERGVFRSRIEALGIPTVPLSLPPWRKLGSLISRYVAVRNLSTDVWKLQPDLIHVNDLWWVPHTIRAVGRLTGRIIPVIAHVRQHVRPEKVHAYALDRANYVVAVSREVQAALEQGGVRSSQVTTLYSGVDLTAYSQPMDGDSIRARHGIPPDAFLIGTVANLLPIKGYETMIEALALIHKKVPTAHYLIVGRGTEAYLGQLKRMCVEQGVTDRVHFVGFQDPTRPYLAAMDVYVQPSRDEAFGIAAVEAMAMGKAIVATRVGGLPEVVDEGRTGFLVPPGDTSAISAIILTLFHDRALIEDMGRRGVVRAREHFNLERTLSGVEQIYQEVLARRRTE